MQFVRRLFGFHSKSGLRKRRRFLKRKVQPRLEALEDRLVLSLSVPQLASLQGAPVALYLDFDGHTEAQWGSTEVHYNVQTPAFDLDSNPSSFSPQETAMMIDVWKHIAEDFAPFKINVTTVEQPASAFANQTALRVAIGGSCYDWYKQSWEDGAGGVAIPGSFNDPSHANTVYVFTQNLQNTAKRIGEAASHETGHALGLHHQSEWAGNILLNEYHPGNAMVSPLMGSYTDPNVERTIWWIGADQNNLNQNDFSLLYSNLLFSSAFSSSNGPFRSDDYPNQIPSTPTIPYQGAFTAEGLITPYAIKNEMPWQEPDVDYFAVSLGNQYLPGSWTVSVEVADVGPNLDARIEVYDTNGNLVAQADPGNSLNASVDLNAGEYWIAVMGHNRMGQMDPNTSYWDAGKYTISSSFSFENLDDMFEPSPEVFFFICDPLLPQILDTLVRDDVDPFASDIPVDSLVQGSNPTEPFDRIVTVTNLDRFGNRPDMGTTPMDRSAGKDGLGDGLGGQSCGDDDDLSLIGNDDDSGKSPFDP